MKILESYRRRIDALDDQIIDLLAKRTNIVREVGHLKFEHDIPAILQDRIEEVRERAAGRAATQDFNPDITRQLYNILIKYSCDIEEEIRDHLLASNTEAAGRP
ncbi:MAG: chorismate mutase [Alphaproteobacteria bacterium CG_4_9_14_3_um_filter_47_13]|nr:MAG: chorismate mutase [Alphaproteobacteria bacterium CG_4_9_14_3_um_filter_47_13]